MGLPDDFTALPGASERTRHHQLGNAFHAGIATHVLRSWVKHCVAERRLQPGLGYPAEDKRLVAWGFRGRRVGEATKPGPDKWNRAVVVDKRSPACRQKSVCRRQKVLTSASPVNAAGGDKWRIAGNSAVRTTVPIQKGVKRQNVTAVGPGVQRFGKRSAMWKSMLPDEKQHAADRTGSIMDRVGGHMHWGSAEPTVLLRRQGRNSTVVAPDGAQFKDFAAALRRDFVLASKSPETWKQYNGWKRCFWAWLEKYGLDIRPELGQACFSKWVDVLSDAVAVMAICYSMGTIDVFVSAVSCYMTHGGMASPFESKEFAAMIEGIRRWKGLGKKKKPPVEPWHVRAIMEGKAPKDFRGGNFSHLQFVQAKYLLLVGWQLFTRPQDFHEFDRCDFRFFQKDMSVTVRYAKNDVRGLTRAPRLAADGGEWCPVKLGKEYFKLLGLAVHPACDKVEGEPARCSVCPAAFPPIWKHGGVQHGKRIPRAQVSLRIKSLFIGLAETGVMSMADAKEFSGKSCRCGGVSSAAAECIRDGVVQGHGGWLTRQSLRHYDLMKPSERALVSSALNAAVRTAQRPV